MNILKVLYKKPNKNSEIIEIEDNYKVFQDLVEGYFECINIGYYNNFFQEYSKKTKRNIIGIINENGLIKKLDVNIFLQDNYQNIIFGNIIFVANYNNNENFISLNDSEIKMLKNFTFFYSF